MAPKAETYIGPPTAHVLLTGAVPHVNGEGQPCIQVHAPCGCAFAFNIQSPTWDRCPLHNHAATLAGTIGDALDALEHQPGVVRKMVTEKLGIDLAQLRTIVAEIGGE